MPLLVTVVAVATIAPSTIAGATSVGAKAAPSRLNVGSSLSVGSSLTSTSGVYRAVLLSRGRFEVERHGAVVWTSTSSTGLDSILTREPDGAIEIATRHTAHVTSPTSDVPKYLTIQNDGDLALISKTGVPIWQGGLRAHVTSSPVAPYTPNAYFGNTNPSVLCYTCEAVNVTGSAPPSDTLDSGTDVDNMTGDFTTSNTLFDAPAIGGDLALSLNYDAQLAQSELTSGTSAGAYGEGWSSNYPTSLTLGSATVTINQGSGAEVTFTESADGGTSTSCQSSGDPTLNQYPGDYPFTAKYTVSGSSYNFCALDSVQGQLSEISGTGFTYEESGGQAIQDYAWTGGIEETTTNTAQVGTPTDGLVYDNVSAGTTSIAGVTLVNECPTTASHGCTVIYVPDGRDIVEVMTSLGEVGQVIDPSGSSYGLNYTPSTSVPNNLTSVTEPSPTGSGTSTWTYEYSTSASPYSSDLVQIYDPDASPTGFSSGALHSTTITYGASGTEAGMVTALIDGSGQSAETSYAYADACATGQCDAAGASQTTTILYPAECPNSTTTCTATSWPTATADIPQEIDQYSNGLETSTQLGSQTNSSEVETWLYSWNLGNGVANTSEVITYPDTLLGSSGLRSASITTDPAGNIISTTNALGDVATSAYNESTSLNLPELAWSYPGPSSNSSSSPPSGASRYTYNSYGQVVTATDPLGNTTYYGYYSHFSSLCYEVSPVLGLSLGWTLSTTPPSCSSSYSTYDSGAVSAPVGSTTFSYDVQGDITGSTIDAGDTGANADPQTTTASYNSMGDTLWEIPPAGQSGSQSSSNAFAISYAYVSGTSLPSYKYQPDGITTQYVYDAAGNLTSSGSSGLVPYVITTTLYDGDNRPCYQIVAYGNFGASCTAGNARGSTEWSYEPGTTDVYQTTDSNAEATTNFYADLAYPNSPTEVEDAGTIEDQYSAYDDYGNACVYGDAAPTLGSTQCSTTPSGDSAATYDALGNQLTITDPSGNTTTNTYADASYPTLETSSVNSMSATTKYLYDADGDLVTTDNPDGTGVTENYNPNGDVCNKMPSLVQYPCGQGPSVAGVTQYGYNDANELTSMSDNTGNPATPTVWSQTTTDTYSLGQLTSTTDGNGKTVNYAYNDDGEVSCIGYPVSTSTNCTSSPSTTNTIVTRSYDAVGRVSSVEDWLGNTTSYTYGNDSTPDIPTVITYPTATGVTATYNYDNDGNLTSLSASSTVTSGTAISDTWTDGWDEQVSVSSINGATSSAASYNANKQVTQATNLGSSTYNDTYTLALNGDITEDAPHTGPATNFAYASGGNELCNTATSATSCGLTPANGSMYTFTTNGERASTTPYVSSVAGTTTNYNWNAYGQLCSTGPSSGPTSTPCGTLPTGGTDYQYNGDGLRMTATTASSTTDSTWDSVTGDIPLNINDATTTGSSTTNTSYIYGDLLFGGTAPIEQITTSSSGSSVSYLVSNQTGVQGVYNGSGSSLGAVQEMAVYSLYGIQTISSGSKVTPFGFQGSYTDPTGLIYLINRYYDPATDQFISIDPDVTTTDQPYVFTNDNPLNSEDPLGLGAFIYVLIQKSTGLPYYVGRSSVSVDSRLVRHIQSGRFNPDEDEVESFDLGDISAGELAAAEQATMTALGTVQRGVKGYNQQNVFRKNSQSYDKAQVEGGDVIKNDSDLLDYVQQADSDILDNIGSSGESNQAVLDAQHLDVYEFENSTLADALGLGTSGGGQNGRIP
ncbi:MAG: RHS repeat-associated core domain-containing protein [Acidimicrobiales bacterium]